MSPVRPKANFRPRLDHKVVFYLSIMVIVDYPQTVFSQADSADDSPLSPHNVAVGSCHILYAVGIRQILITEHARSAQNQTESNHLGGVKCRDLGTSGTLVSQLATSLLAHTCSQGPQPNELHSWESGANMACCHPSVCPGTTGLLFAPVAPPPPLTLTPTAYLLYVVQYGNGCLAKIRHDCVSLW